MCLPYVCFVFCFDFDGSGGPGISFGGPGGSSFRKGSSSAMPPLLPALKPPPEPPKPSQVQFKSCIKSYPTYSWRDSFIKGSDYARNFILVNLVLVNSASFLLVLGSPVVRFGLKLVSTRPNRSPEAVLTPSGPQNDQKQQKNKNKQTKTTQNKS